MTETEVRERIAAAPKTDLHVHLDGSLRPETIVELARERGVELPSDDPAELADYLFVRDARNLEDYLARFDLTVSVMQSADAIERIAYELCQDAAAENVRYMEIRFSPILLTRGGLPLPETVDAPLRGMRRAQEELGIESNLIICGIRNMSPDVSRDLADLTVAYKNRGVVAFDLAGAEYNYPAKKHKNAFYMVRNANIGATIHAGEAYGPESIYQAITDLHADRIGHGTYLLDPGAIRDPSIADPEDYVERLGNYIADRRITLEVCLTSNLQTNPQMQRLEEHSFSTLRAHRLSTTLCTDNRLISHTTVTKELQLAVRHLGLDRHDLKSIVIYGFKRSFFPGGYLRKRQYVRQVIDYYDRIEQEFPA